MKELIEKMASYTKIGNPEARAMAAYQLGSKVRNFAGEIAYSLAQKNDPYGELAHKFPKVKNTGKKAVKALQDFAKEVSNTERYIDVSPKMKGRLKEDVFGEASQPKLNKYDPGSLLGWTVFLLNKHGLEDAADSVRNVSKEVSKAWQKRSR